MKKYSLMSLCLLFILAACGASSNSAEEDVTTPAGPALENAPEVEEDIIPRVTITPLSETEGADDAYPVVAAPTLTPYPEGYPAPVVPLPVNPYPAEDGTIWVMKPAGEQCAESLVFETEQDARAALEAAGIETYKVKTVELMVTTSCGSATSIHYAVNIDAADLANAEALEWTAVSEEELEG